MTDAVQYHELPHVLHAVRTGALDVLQLGPDTEARDLNRDNPVQFTQIAQFDIVQQASVHNLLGNRVVPNWSGYQLPL